MPHLRAMISLIVAMPLIAAAPGPTPTPHTDSLPVGACINIGNTFESPTEAAWGGDALTDKDISVVAQAGFTTIRLPVRWDTHAGDAAPWTVDQSYIARIRHFVTLAQQSGLNVILNSHNFLAIHADPIATTEKFAGIWRQIGAAFADQPRDKVWFELENEPHDKLTNANLMQVMLPALAAIRETNPDRPVIIGGENWSGVDSLATLPLPDDTNIVPTFHYYEPFDFTHQGATWVDPSPPLGRKYGTKEDADRLVRDVEKIRAYVARTGKTPFMGETGAHTTIPTEDRIAYHRAVHDAFAPMGIGMCIWAYRNTFRFYEGENRKWIPGLRAAIGLKE